MCLWPPAPVAECEVSPQDQRLGPEGRHRPAYCPGPPGRLSALSISLCTLYVHISMVLLYGRAGRLTAKKPAVPAPPRAGWDAGLEPGAPGGGAAAQGQARTDRGGGQVGCAY
jgi:hypothetical protein